ncbi:MAG: tRNA (adenosine(37)-N6)-threonylcarbamoyltransferase complex dimerization subunit type 1 TsaB, partial [Elusimicrobia bacterium]|nr:tRNA (adenosine(37)-N6)-threonylcarbamoyltransferase complex dimerization subunit type 1 TsaB [Elusimicrobiota bacterium]
MAKNKKIIIGLSTAGSRIKVALKHGADKFKAKSIKEPNQEKVFLKIIEKFLSFEKAEFKDLDSLCIVKGPGRFTGIRISLTFAAMLKVLVGLKVFTITGFEILAFQASVNLRFKKWLVTAKNPKIAVIIHAFKKEYFLQVFKAMPGVVSMSYAHQATKAMPGVVSMSYAHQATK